MSKKIVFGMLALFLVGLVSASLFGCGMTAEQIKKLLDPGTIPASKEAAIISGGAKYTGGTIDVNLNAIIISGETLTLDPTKFNVFVGKSGTATSEWESVTLTVPSGEKKPMDMVFIVDNTGSMSGRIQAVKNSIISFTASLDAAGVDARFGVVSFGDTTSECSTLDLPATAEAVKTWLTNLSGVGGGDAPENPLTAVMKAFDEFSWRTGTQRVFIVITDNPCHQVGDGTDYTTYTAAAVHAALLGKATVYAVSPMINKYATYPSAYSTRTTTEGDVRWLADGFGWFLGIAATTEYASKLVMSGTGGKWIELPDSGDIDLNALGISTAVTKGYTVRFTYTMSAGVWYIHVLADTNGDGVMDSDLIITLTVSSSSSVSSSPVVGLTPVTGAKVGGKN